MLSPLMGFPDGSDSKNLPVTQEIQTWSLGQEDPRETEKVTYSSILALQQAEQGDPHHQAKNLDKFNKP